MTAPTITIAICTAARPVQLARALESVAAQRLSPAETIVVDNAPDAGEVAPLLARDFPWAVYVAEPRRGCSIARNRALRLACGEIVAFLDDDAVADAGWLAQVAAAFERPETAAVTCRVEALSVETPGGRLIETAGGYDRGPRPMRLPADAAGLLDGRRAPLVAWAMRIGGRGAFAVRREAALAVGGFDEGLDRPGLHGGGEHDLVWRLLRAGHEVVYAPEARVRHEHRPDVGGATDQLVGHHQSLVALLAKLARQEHGRTRLEIALFALWRVIKPGVRLVRRALGRDPLPASLLWRMWRDSWRGLGRYHAGYHTALSLVLSELPL